MRARRPPTRLLRWLGVVLVGLGGAAVGWALAPGSQVYVGPLLVQVDIRPSLSSGVHVQLPPVGNVTFDTHLAPVAVNASVLSVDLAEAQQLIASPQGLLALQLAAPEVLRDAAIEAVTWSVGCALAGALVGGLAVYRLSWRPVQTTAAALAVLLALGGVTVATFDAAALRAPRFTGLLQSAPYIAGEGRDVAERLESYRSGLADFVQSVTTLYAVADRLPVLPRGGETTTVLHVSDIHLNPLGFDVADRLVEQFGVDAVVDTGDITTWGTGVESSTLSRIGELGVPYVFVRGNHDSASTEAAVAAQPNAVVLDGDTAEVAGLVFAGIGDPRFTPEGEEPDDERNRELVLGASEELADLITSRPEADDGTHGVDVALIHDPSVLDPLFGEVPLVLSGHYHRRIVNVYEPGTRVMVQGSTGGAGITANGLEALGEGEPLSLTATLLYFATSGDREGRLVAYDEVTVGGLGLASVTIERTVVESEEATGDETPAEPSEPPSTSPTTSPTPSP
ncbi:MAG TPA: metallophosphoesterase [Actinomycetales bacterium]|nr:metallophosphoesterase [Actinomycetales bacterium]